MYKEGDKVRVVLDKSCHGVRIGNMAIVKEVKEDVDCLFISDGYNESYCKPFEITPFQEEITNDSEQPTLRDQFAMAALPFVLSKYGHKRSAKTAYELADAMLKER